MMDNARKRAQGGRVRERVWVMFSRRMFGITRGMAVVWGMSQPKVLMRTMARESIMRRSKAEGVVFAVVGR